MINDKILFVGFGAYGSVLANVASQNCDNVYVWDINKKKLNDFKSTRLLPSLFDYYEFRRNINVIEDFEEALKGSKYIVLSVPSKNIIDVIEQLNKSLHHKVHIISIAKGFVPNTEESVYSLTKNNLKKELLGSFSVLSGPSHAREIIENKLTGVNVASDSKQVGNVICNIFATDNFYVKQIPNIQELIFCGALKNAYSVGAGLIRALYNSRNTSALYLNKAFNEMKHILRVLGMNPEVASELCGLGDLIVTGTTKMSRNYRAGFEFGIHKSAIRIFEESQRSTIEGIHSISVLRKILKKRKEKAVIIDALFEVLFQGKNTNIFNVTLVKK